jgi:NAD(P)-dependent dehydrogenase (short-subunit alcohol dehydrogenase family)
VKRILVEYIQQIVRRWRCVIRINAVHPTDYAHLLHSDGLHPIFRPDLERPTWADVESAFIAFQAMLNPYVEPADISNDAPFLASDESRHAPASRSRSTWRAAEVHQGPSG